MNNPLAFTDPSGLQAGTVPDEEPGVITVSTYWDSAKNTFGSFAGYLKTLGVSVEQAVRYFAYSNGGTEDSGARTSSGPVLPVRQFGGTLNPTTAPSITAFTDAMKRVDAGIQYVPIYSSLYNSQKAGFEADLGTGSGTNAIFQTGMFGVDLGTTVFTGGTSKVAGTGLKETGEGGFRLALGLGDNLFDFAKSTNSTTYFERAGTRAFIPEKFEKMALEATEINFNLKNFSFGTHADWIHRGAPELPRTATSFELNYILSREEILRKTNFFVHP